MRTGPTERVSWPFPRLGLLLVILVLLAVFAWRARRPQARSSGTAGPHASAAVSARVVEEFTRIESTEDEADRTVWGPERQAEAVGSMVEAFWDALNEASNALARLGDAPLRSLVAPTNLVASELPHGIRRLRGGGAGATISPAQWRSRLGTWGRAGWRLDQSEWRHRRFEPATAERGAQSLFEVSLDLSRLNPPGRAQVRADLRLTWPSESSSQSGIAWGDGAVEDLEIRTRDGEPVFRPWALLEIQPFDKTSWIDPLILRDARRGERPELLLVARNQRLRSTPAGAWEAVPLSRQHPGLIFTSLCADFTGDGQDDLLLAVRSGLVLLRGGLDGGWDAPAERVWTAPERLQYVQAFTCGDMDQDGDLDVFLGQYRTPYTGGQMPHPYFDANDGPPAYLLRNRGDGRFEDVTVGSGLEPRRHRRSYAASFVDLDHDGDLDLLVTSDFAGIDFHANDGTSHFEDRTLACFDDPSGFGMSHAFSDFDSDGNLDVLMVGMTQDTVDRLDALGLERSGFESWTARRARLAFGNRLFFGQAGGVFHQRPVGGQVARAGWAWSAVAADFDDDGFPDLHIINGHDTRESVREYEPEFWTHDIYVGTSTPREAADAYFISKFARTRGQGWSYGGHHKNRFFLNLGGAGFAEVGHLMGVALEEDSRNALAVDLDQDGDLDLVVTTFEVYPRQRQTVRLFENTLQDRGHWIGFRLVAAPSGIPVMGASVTVWDRHRTQTRVLVSGDGYRSQGGSVVRFGLGDESAAEDVEVRWTGGRLSRLGPLAADRIHDVNSPAR